MTVRYILAAAGALALMSNVSFAQTDSTKTIVMKTAPNGTGYSKSITKRHVDRYGNLVIKRKTYTNGLSGSSVNRSETITHQDGGTTTKSTMTVR